MRLSFRLLPVFATLIAAPVLAPGAEADSQSKELRRGVHREAVQLGPRPFYLSIQSTTDVTDNDGDYFEVLDVLAQDVGILGIFSDWPATVTYYANCMGLDGDGVAGAETAPRPVRSR